MASKWSIENSANIKMLINMIQTAGGIDEDDNIFLPVEKTEHSFLKISKEKLKKENTNQNTEPKIQVLVKPFFMFIAFKFMNPDLI